MASARRIPILATLLLGLAALGPAAGSPASGCGCVRRWSPIEHQGLRPFNLFQAVDDRVWLAMSRDCLQLTADGGRHWRDLYCVAQSSSLLDTFQALSNREMWLLLNASTLLHTVDGGDTWRPQAVPDRIWRGFRFLDRRTGWLVGERLAIGDDPDVVGSAAVTSDGGDTWQEPALPVSLPYRWRLWSVWPASPSQAWILGNVLLKTSDGGATWEPPPLPGAPREDGKTLSIEFNGPAIGWILRAPGTRFLMTADGGTSWRLRHSPPGVERISDLLYVNAAEAWLVADRVYCSPDGGKRWHSVLADIQGSGAHQVVALPNGALLAVSGSGPAMMTGACSKTAVRGDPAGPRSAGER